MKISNVARKTVLIATLFLGIAGAVSAQKDSTAHSPEARAKTLTDKMKTELSLSDEQTSKVYDINLKYAQKNQESLKGEGSKMEKAKAVKGDNKDKNKELKEVLTEEQFEKYKDLQQEKRATMREKLKNRKSGGLD